jgi:predicted GH43/DUF377 family glycosyl hydrolase
MKHLFKSAVALAFFFALTTSSSALAQFPFHWSKDPGNPISTDFGGSTVLFHEGIYKCWGDESGGINYGTSPDGRVWTRHPSSPVLLVGEYWYNENALNNPAVVVVDGLYHMFYSCIAADNDNRIAHATSTDGIVWENDPNNPVMDLGPEGSLDSNELMHPTVLYEAPYYRMWYNGHDGTAQRILYAYSEDGVQWTRSPEAALDLGAPGDWDDNQLGMMNVMTFGGSYYMFYTGIDWEGEGPVGAVRIGCATSGDGLSWTRRSPSEPVLSVGDAGAWDDLGVLLPVVMETSSGLMMWYGGTRDFETFGWGIATAEYPSPVPEARGNILGQNFPNPFNPTTTIRFTLEEESQVILQIFDATGSLVRQLVDGWTMSPGMKHVPWNGRDDDGRMVATGVYFYRLDTGARSETRRMALIK